MLLLFQGVGHAQRLTNRWYHRDLGDLLADHSRQHAGKKTLSWSPVHNQWFQTIRIGRSGGHCLLWSHECGIKTQANAAHICCPKLVHVVHLFLFLLPHSHGGVVVVGNDRWEKSTLMVGIKEKKVICCAAFRGCAIVRQWRRTSFCRSVLRFFPTLIWKGRGTKAFSIPWSTALASVLITTSWQIIYACGLLSLANK